MTTPSPRVLELKAAALLWRSPLAALDLDGEPARQRELEAWLARQQISLTDTERELIEGCFDEAQDAALGDGAVPATSFSPGAAPPPLRHPLSAEEIPQSDEPKTAWQQPLGFLKELPDRGGDLAHWYRKLWRTLMRCPPFRELPAHPTLRDHSVAAHRSMTAALVGARFDGGQPAFLALHVGPVQGFIEAARRTSDLALGSYTVGYLAFSGAVALAKVLGPDVLLNPDVSCRALADKLLFDDLELKDRPNLLRAALMNRVLAVVPEAAADDLAKTMAAEVSETWRNMGEAAAHAWDKARTNREEFFEQLAQHLEIDQVALPWPKDRGQLLTLLKDAGWSVPPWLLSHERDSHHPAAAFGVLAELTERMLSAHRSALQPTGGQGDHRPKCTSCGIREQLGPRSEWPNQQQRVSREFFEKKSEELQKSKSSGRDDPQRTSLQLTRGEGLCAVCLTKRLAAEEYFGDKERNLGLSWDNGDRVLLRFPSTATFASAPFRFEVNADVELGRHLDEWIKQLDVLHGGGLLDFTPPGNLLEGLGPRGADSDLLAQEGTWFYELSYEPLSAWRSHFGKDPDHDTRDRFDKLPGPLKTAAAALRKLRQISKKSASEYYAVIVLDGDEMGDWKAGRHRSSPSYRELGAFPSGREDVKRPVHPALYTELSRRLALLNDKLHQTVARHLGRLVYHGGDDVLAFVPLVSALPCLDAIRALICSPNHLGSKVTVSAGLSITHWKTPLSYALGEARRAEKSAKAAGKDRFAISLNPRSGEQLSLILPWNYGDAARQQAGTKATIPLLQALLQAERQGAQDEKAGLSSGKAAYVLRDELPALSADALREAFQHRALQLLFNGSDAANRQPVAEFFACLLDAEPAAKRSKDDPQTKDAPETKDDLDTTKDAQRRMQTVTNLLLLLRFLSRQENGIDPEALLKAVEHRMTQQEVS
jgi:CRISPR-associated protein Cmr2